jgi:hypothetical protein
MEEDSWARISEEAEGIAREVMTTRPGTPNLGSDRQTVLGSMVLSFLIGLGEGDGGKWYSARVAGSKKTGGSRFGKWATFQRRRPRLSP